MCVLLMEGQFTPTIIEPTDIISRACQLLLTRPRYYNIYHPVTDDQKSTPKFMEKARFCVLSKMSLLIFESPISTARSA